MSYRKEYKSTIKYTTTPDNLGVDFSIYSLEDLKNLWRETLENGMYGICFSMYEDGQEPGHKITKKQVEKRIKILKPHTKWIRSFSCIEGNQYIPEIAKKYGLKTLVGAWLGDDLKKNEKEIKGLIRLAKKGLVDIAAVGNEVLYRKELSEEQLLNYIERVKEAIPDVSIGYVDAYYEFSERPKITEACDVVLANCYPYWEGCNLENSLEYMQQMYSQAKLAANGKKVIITETGWPSAGGNLKGAIANPNNAMKYYINAQVWSEVEEIEMFYFSSFDESWKIGDEGDVGAFWGLWDKYGNLKY
ncbi:glycosyl hydrolase [Polaribacter reichenbachii]|uniref:Endo-1,3-beta-glucanase btgC n=1 Tax=Polaribacter reichenbachii TaxID=996801 RepID=A0A1B8U751_9FLAO|nr:glycosyl hydrolase family 17 protein [Polaribacter reichenbachii]APZ46230.1 glycosyl hydrolase [Polaribacter reichenbachii]AUC20092.1 glycosyl hydrolase [Polaribacter reichenbachii]OBY67649.1 glycosyl hydrolase [Polaribacter reichenbachii]